MLLICLFMLCRWCWCCCLLLWVLFAACFLVYFFNFYFIFFALKYRTFFCCSNWNAKRHSHTRTTRATKNPPDVFTLTEDAFNSTLYLNSKLVRSHPHSRMFTNLRAAQNSHQISGQFETGKNKSFLMSSAHRNSLFTESQPRNSINSHFPINLGKTL